MKPWALALGGSLALHLAVAAVFRGNEVPVVKPAPVARRGDGFVSFTPVSVVEPPNSAPAPAPAPAPLRVVKASAPAPSALAAAVALDEGGETAVAAEVAGVAQGTGGPAEVAPAAAPAPAPAGSGAGRADPSAEVIALVHARLAAVADRCYPAAARRFQQRGTVQLSFCTDANGGAASTSVTQSSGAALLDAAARGCVLENAAPFPLEASAHCFSVPVRFGLTR